MYNHEWEVQKVFFKDPIMNHCWKDQFDVLYASEFA